MTVEQFYEALEKKGVNRKEYINSVTLLFFAADLAECLAVHVEEMMAPYGCLGVPLRQNIKKIHKMAGQIVYYADQNLTANRQEDFGNDAERFKAIAYGWANLCDDKPILKSDIEAAVKELTKSDDMKVITNAQLQTILNQLVTKQ